MIDLVENCSIGLAVREEGRGEKEVGKDGLNGSRF